ncbi:hypothetical protein D3C71_1473730 [compost metagenome]
MADVILRRRREDRLSQLRILAQSLRQLDAVHRSGLLILPPAAARDIAPDHTFDVHAFRLAHHHDPVFQQLPVLFLDDAFQTVHIDMHHMILQQILRLAEPERAQPVQHIAFVRHGRLQHVIECRDPVGHDDQHMLSQIIQLAHLAFVQQRSVNQIYRGRDGRLCHGCSSPSFYQSISSPICGRSYPHSSDARTD